MRQTAERDNEVIIKRDAFLNKVLRERIQK
jgi:hypothetical protein